MVLIVMPIIMWLCLPATQFRAKWFLSYILSKQRYEKQSSADWNIIFLNDRTADFQSQAIGVQLVILQVGHCSALIVPFRVFMPQRHEERVWQIYCCLIRQLWPTPQPKCLGLGDRWLVFMAPFFRACVDLQHLNLRREVTFVMGETTTVKLVINAADSDCGWLMGLWAKKTLTICYIYSHCQ